MGIGHQCRFEHSVIADIYMGTFCVLCMSDDEESLVLVNGEENGYIPTGRIHTDRQNQSILKSMELFHDHESAARIEANRLCGHESALHTVVFYCG